jgi:hypothetical protein
MSKATINACLLIAATMLLAGCGEDPDPLPDLDKALDLRAAAGGGMVDGPVMVDPGRGWATLKGKFVFDGAAPSLPPITPTNVPGGCGMSQFPNQSLLVGPGGGLQNVVIFLKKPVIDLEGNPRINEETPPLPTLFDQKNCIFTSHVLAVQAKKDISFKNSDPVSHNTNNKFFNSLIPPGESLTFAFPKGESRPLETSCTIHPWMKAYIFVRDDPYVAVSQKDGTFEIKNLPAETEITLVVWHEKAPGGKLQDSGGLLKRGEYKVKLTEGQDQEVTFTIPSGSFR